jgi:small subunit ribosomal protein S20
LANIQSAIKRARQAEKRQARNRMVRSSSRTAVRKALALIAARNREEAAVAVQNAISEIDKAAQKGIIHANKAARSKSRLMQRYNAMG